MASIVLDPKLWEVDRIEMIDNPDGRYVRKVVVRGHFIWDAPREREIEDPMFHWWVDGKRYGAVIPAQVDERGNVDDLATSLTLARLIRESKAGADANRVT